MSAWTFIPVQRIDDGMPTWLFKGMSRLILQTRIAEIFNEAQRWNLDTQPC